MCEESKIKINSFSTPLTRAFLNSYNIKWCYALVMVACEKSLHGGHSVVFPYSVPVITETKRASQPGKTAIWQMPINPFEKKMDLKNNNRPKRN